MVLCEQTTVSHDLPDIVALTWDHRGSTPLAQTERILARDAGQREIDRRFFAIVTDLVGTPTELVAENGDIAWRTRSTLWGTTAWNRSSTTYTPLRFPGQYHDPETGLHYNLFRHYDPATARYLTPDPLGLAPAPNPAAYVHNPHTWTDPLASRFHVAGVRWVIKNAESAPDLQRWDLSRVQVVAWKKHSPGEEASRVLPVCPYRKRWARGDLPGRCCAAGGDGPQDRSGSGDIGGSGAVAQAAGGA
jgi:RHS repeat-associated protein